MESDHEEANQAASMLVRSLWLIVFLIACEKINKGTKANVFVVKVVEKPVVQQQTKKPPKKKTKKIYLTFDDGPNKGTSKVFHIAQQEKVPVSFFLVGEHAFASITQKAMWDSLKMSEAIELCNHSYTHAHNHYQTYYSKPDSVVNDFKRCHDSLDLDNDIGRTPGRNAWRIDTLQYTDLKQSKAAVDSLQAAGFVIMGWDLEWHYDHKTFTVINSAEDLLKQIDSLFENKKTRTPGHLVLLAHDQVYATLEDSIELHYLVKKLKENEEYELQIVSDYPGVKKE